MKPDTKKIIQYLDEAHATELGLVRVLQSQIAMTPRGGYRTALERHLTETRGHARRIEARQRELGRRGSPIQAGIGAAETVLAQGLAIAKTPLDLLRGSGGEEKVLKNAKDAAATEALEIATYTAIEQLARDAGDEETARLAASIRADEERMLQRVLKEIPKLTDAVFGADVHGHGSYDAATTGAADATRTAARKTAGGASSARRSAARTTASGAGASRTAARKTATKAKRTAAAPARRVAPREQDLPIPRYGRLTADEVVAKLPELSQAELAQVETYERRKGKRTTVLARIDTLRGSEPWSGYDGQTVDEIRTRLGTADDPTAKAVREYERAHKDRAGVLESAQRELASA
jgi:ferritin-like metal-binding protein YciE